MKNDGNLRKCSLFFLLQYVGGWKNDKGFLQNRKILQKIKNGHFSFFDILQLPHTVISNSEKLTHPNMQCN